MTGTLVVAASDAVTTVVPPNVNVLLRHCQRDGRLGVRVDDRDGRRNWRSPRPGRCRPAQRDDQRRIGTDLEVVESRDGDRGAGRAAVDENRSKLIR